MLGQKIAQLSEEDLIEWRDVLAAYEIVMAGGCTWPKQDAIDAVVRYYEFFERMKFKYVADDDDLVQIGPIHGDVREDEDED